jgi:hypothetical protein
MFPGGVVVTILSTYVFYLLADLPSGCVLEVKIVTWLCKCLDLH